MSTSLETLVHYVMYVYFGTENMTYGQVKFNSVADAALWLVSRPADEMWYVGLSLLIGVSASRYLSDLRDLAWSEFYGEKLRQLLSAGRSVEISPTSKKLRNYDAETSPSGSARELLGLPARFTQAELRRAWVRLARELHPDRWHSEGKAMVAMKEAALKRVNAARDELESLAIN